MMRIIEVHNCHTKTLAECKNAQHSQLWLKCQKEEGTIIAQNINHCEVCGKSIDKSQAWVHDKECDLWYHSSCYTEYTKALKTAVQRLEDIE